VNQDQQQHPITSFEDRLLGQLRAVVAERGAAAAAEESTTGEIPAWRRGPRLALAGAAVLAVAAAALVVSAGGDDTPAAYAVEAQPDGQVSVEIRSLQDAKGLEEALRDAGVPASVDYLGTGMACREPRFQPVTAPAPSDGGKVTSSMSQSNDGATVFTLSHNAVGPGQTLVLTASPGPGGNGDAVQMQVAEGQVGQCVPVEAAAGTPPTGAPQGADKGGTGPSTTKSGVGPGGSDKGTSFRTG
jgi:hypothetical protein